MRDQTNSIATVDALNGGTINTDTTTVGAVIDTQGYDAVTFSIFSGARSDGTYTPLIEESDLIAMGDATPVADGNLIGTEAAAAISAANKRAEIGYRGVKRYVRLSIVSTSTSSGAYIGATAMLGLPRHQGAQDQI